MRAPFFKIEVDMRIDVVARPAAVFAVLLAMHGAAAAQPAQLAAGQVSGAELQSWVDADGLAVGGISLQDGCQYFAKNRGGERYLTVFCPDSTASWTVKGEGKVVGNSWCVKFQYPNGASSDQCEDFFRTGDNKYEIRLKGKPINRAYRLIP